MENRRCNIGRLVVAPFAVLVLLAGWHVVAQQADQLQLDAAIEVGGERTADAVSDATLVAPPENTDAESLPTIDLGARWLAIEGPEGGGREAHEGADLYDVARYFLQAEEHEALPYLVKRYEGRVSAKARELRQLQQEHGSDDARVRQLHRELRSAVADLFEMRQKLQRKQLADYQERLERIERQIEQREPIKDAIINRRVEELLNPALRWQHDTDDALDARHGFPQSDKDSPARQSQTLPSQHGTSVVKEHLYEFHARTSSEHRRDILQVLSKVYEDENFNLHGTGRLTFRTTDDKASEIIALLKKLDVSSSERAKNTVRVVPLESEGIHNAPLSRVMSGHGSSLQWPLVRGNPQMTGEADAPLPDNLAVLWSFRIDDHTFGHAAAIVDNVAYIGDQAGTFYALDMNSGVKKWEFVNPDQLAGFSAAPAVYSGKVYIGDESGRFHCLRADTGECLWSFRTGGQISASANFYQDQVLIGSHDATLYCLSASGGKLLWEYSCNDQIRSTPTIVGNRCLVAGCDSLLHVLDLDRGKPLVQIEIGSPTGVTAAVRDGIAYFGVESGEVCAMDVAKANVVWKRDVSEQPIRSSCALTEDLLLVGSHDHRLYALDRLTGRTVWTFLTKGDVESSPVVAGSRVYFGSDDGRIYGLDVATGTKLWQCETGESEIRSPAVAEGRLVIPANGAVFCLGDKSDD